MNSKRKQSLLLVVALLTVAAGASLANTTQIRCDLFHGQADAPAANAAPEKVVRAYLDAVVKNDRETARTLTSDSYLKHEESVVDSPFCNWKKLSDINISPATPTSYDQGGYKEAVNVTVEFHLQQREEMSMINGPNLWSYTLGRNPPSERWEIISGGLG